MWEAETGDEHKTLQASKVVYIIGDRFLGMEGMRVEANRYIVRLLPSIECCSVSYQSGNEGTSF